MDLYEAIYQRRTVKDFKPEPVPAEILERILDAGRWAQNHGMTQPWRFTLLGPETAEALARVHESSRHKIVKPQTVIVVSNVLSKDENVRREDYGATSCAIQNMALAAWSEGIGMVWSSGKFTRDERTYSLVDLDPQQDEIVGFLTFGFPNEVPAAPVRKPLAEVFRHLP